MAYFAHIRRNYPPLWEELRKLAAIPNKVSENFNKRYTFTELEARMDIEDKKHKFNLQHPQQTLF